MAGSSLVKPGQDEIAEAIFFSSSPQDFSRTVLRSRGEVIGVSAPIPGEGQTPLGDGGRWWYNRQEAPHPGPLPASGAREHSATLIQLTPDSFTASEGAR
jgi:hypothetical protein